ncbi:xaa-Pro aminopeptidase 1 [Trichoplusia ni]|uniref:Xaa-Pro aminopeptidase 1 n=1 Tax=Trichoplusia ni TaxID=7111 RepID=A0A7E5WBH5_TRINI|nr:xaa-Pro aminopeptidase 1 [Trichoplusia ni]
MRFFIISVCWGARMSQQGPLMPTATAPVLTSMMARSPVPLTIIQEQPTVPAPPICADATDITTPLSRLRSAMKNPAYTQMNAFFDAFLIFYTDEHLSEEPLQPERRLEYISGWDGAGTGAVLADGGAAVWVPSGDVRRARTMLTCAWLVIDADDPSQPTVAEWISERLARSGRVGGDARLTSVGEWQGLSTALQREGLQLVHIPTLVDQLWNEEPDPDRRRPDFPKTVAKNYEMEHAGESWRDKVTAVRNELRSVGADALIVTALDEVAWLLNVRGRDLPYARLLKAFVVVSMRDVRVFVPPGKLSVHVRDALAVYNCVTNNCTRVSEYTTIYSELRRAPESKILIPAAGTFQRGASAAIAQSVPPAKRVFLLSPIIYLKAQKNEAEVKGMKKAHLRDAVAMCTLLNYLETKSGLSEMSVEVTVDITRETQAGYVGPSMKTRVAYAANAADPDYRATNVTNRRIFKNATLVIQSGGQYDEGTTVVTRTVHYGTPSRDERRAYTTVMRSMAALAGLRAPAALPAAHADPVARAPLWAAKQDYPHPTGHGVGAALARREDPVVLDYRQDTNLHTLREGYFITIEPGWYEPGKYGVRLGNIFEVVSRPNGYLGFKESTLLPYDPKLIDKALLTEYEITWLNGYNDRIRKEVGPELKARGLTDVYYWMMNKTIPFELPSKAKKLTSSSAEPNVVQKVTNIILAITVLHVVV